MLALQLLTLHYFGSNMWRKKTSPRSLQGLLASVHMYVAEAQQIHFLAQMLLGCRCWDVIPGDADTPARRCGCSVTRVAGYIVLGIGWSDADCGDGTQLPWAAVTTTPGRGARAPHHTHKHSPFPLLLPRFFLFHSNHTFY